MTQPKYQNGKAYGSYKVTKKKVKKVVQEIRFKVYKELYYKLNREKSTCHIARRRERNPRVLTPVKCVKDKEQNN